MKKRIRLTESDLHRIVKESVNSVLKEANLDDFNYGFNNFSELQGNDRTSALEQVLDSELGRLKQNLLRALS